MRKSGETLIVTTRSILFQALFILIFTGILGAQTTREKSALLTGDEAKRLAKQCSRDSPSDFTGTWEPPVDVLTAMEKRLSEISSLRAKCCIEDAGIENPKAWYLQYAALVWHGKKIIYISAIGREQPTDFVREGDSGPFKEVASDSWKSFAVVICDGANAWGVIYDPESGKFSNLSINGVG